jgi:hypothetical protein
MSRLFLSRNIEDGNARTGGHDRGRGRRRREWGGEGVTPVVVLVGGGGAGQRRLAHGGRGLRVAGREPFLRVHWVAVPQVSRARRVNRWSWKCAAWTSASPLSARPLPGARRRHPRERRRLRRLRAPPPTPPPRWRRGGSGARSCASREPFLRVDWVAVPEVLRARRLNRMDTCYRLRLLPAAQRTLVDLTVERVEFGAPCSILLPPSRGRQDVPRPTDTPN